MLIKLKIKSLATTYFLRTFQAEIQRVQIVVAGSAGTFVSNITKYCKERNYILYDKVENLNNTDNEKYRLQNDHQAKSTSC